MWGRLPSRSGRTFYPVEPASIDSASGPFISLRSSRAVANRWIAGQWRRTRRRQHSTSLTSTISRRRLSSFSSRFGDSRTIRLSNTSRSRTSSSMARRRQEGAVGSTIDSARPPARRTSALRVVVVPSVRVAPLSREGSILTHMSRTPRAHATASCPAS